MDFCFILLLLLFGLNGIQSITSVDHISVVSGGSISIPCFYHWMYHFNVKYLCKEKYNLPQCINVATTTKPDLSNKYVISDDKMNNIFTVTINNLTLGDAGFYSCGVPLSIQHRKRFQLSFKGVDGLGVLYVDDQYITGFKGENMTVNFNTTIATGGKVQWCRPSLAPFFCITEASGNMDETFVTINTSIANMIIVTMSGLVMESTGWYWCDKGGFQMPVHITHVNEPAPTTSEPPTTTTMTTQPQTTYIPSTSPISSTTAGTTGGGQQVGHSSMDVTILATSLSLVVLLVIAALIGLMVFMRYKKAKGKTAANVTHPSPLEVMYTTVVPVQKGPKVQTPKKSVIYSIIIKDNGTQQMTEPDKETVIYDEVCPE